MNRNSTLRRQATALLTAVVTGALVLSTGCTSLAGDGDSPVEYLPTVYVAVAPLDLPDDHFASTVVYVPVAPLDLPDDYYTRASEASESGSDETVTTASADDWMVP